VDPEETDKKLDKLDEKNVDIERRLTKYRLDVVEWHTKIRTDFDHLLDAHHRRKTECGSALSKKVDDLDKLITSIRIAMAKHAVWIGIGILAVSVALNAIVRYFLK